MSLTQHLLCDDCGYVWGPVGVRPWNPDGPSQHWLLCRECNEPQAQVLDVGEVPLCAYCVSADIGPLDHCPQCGQRDLRWI